MKEAQIKWEGQDVRFIVGDRVGIFTSDDRRPRINLAGDVVELEFGDDKKLRVTVTLNAEFIDASADTREAVAAREKTADVEQPERKVETDEDILREVSGAPGDMKA